MKKITLSNLINLTKEDILSIEPHDLCAIDELELYIDSTYSLVNTITSLNDNYSKKYDKGNFDFTLAVKGYLNLINRGIRAYKKEIGFIELDSNDKIYLSSLYVTGFLFDKGITENHKLIIYDAYITIDDLIYVQTNKGYYILSDDNKKLIKKGNSNNFINIDEETYKKIDQIVADSLPF